MVSPRLLFLGAIAPAAIAALPAVSDNAPRAEYPEFYPPPGYPSLAELNLTTEMLHAEPQLLPIPEGYTGAPTSHGDFSVQYDARCEFGFLGTANVDDVIVCFNFLVALGNYNVDVSDWRQVATYNSAIILAHATPGPTSSTAYNIALAVQWAFTNCNRGGQVTGSAAAYGNGDMVIYSGGNN